MFAATSFVSVCEQAHRWVETGKIFGCCSQIPFVLFCETGPLMGLELM